MVRQADLSAALGDDVSLVQLCSLCIWCTRRPCPCSLFHGRHVNRLYWDCDGILDCSGIVIIRNSWCCELFELGWGGKCGETG